MNKRKNQRGYNLVELAIIVTVALMMGSWLVTNYYQWDKQNREKETERAIEGIKDAIIGYAASHTAQSNIIVNADATRLQRWRLPAGRPYLPCPDITGDGVEDRRPPAVAASVVVTVQAMTSVLETGGDCYSNKGWVPWKTLNVPPADPWGNVYTYRVDGHFSNAMLGFDQKTVNDQASYTRPLTLLSDVTNTTPPITTTLGAVRATVGLTERISRIVGSSSPSLLISIWGVGTNLLSENAPSLVCSSAPCPFSYSTPPTSPLNVTLSLLAGEVATTAITVETGGYELAFPVYAVHDSGDIVSGPPVVVLSHGANGYGAARRPNQEGIIQCVDVPDSRTEELQNAFRYVGITISMVVSQATLVYNCPSETPAGYRQNGFVAHPRTDSVTSPGGGFDDIVSWMATEELVAALQARGVFPVGELPPIGLEDY